MKGLTKKYHNFTAKKLFATTTSTVRKNAYIYIRQRITETEVSFVEIKFPFILNLLKRKDTRDTIRNIFL
jgi:hypothetical protein